MKKPTKYQKHYSIKKGEEVIVLSGVSRGQKGKVISILKKKDRAIVEGINMIKKATRPTQEDQKGGIIEKEGALHVSKLMSVKRYESRPKTKVEAKKEVKKETKKKEAKKK